MGDNDESDYTNKVVAVDMIDSSERTDKIQSRQKHQTDGPQQITRANDRVSHQTKEQAGTPTRPQSTSRGCPTSDGWGASIWSILGLSACGLALFWWLSANCASCMGTTLTAI